MAALAPSAEIPSNKSTIVRSKKTLVPDAVRGASRLLGRFAPSLAARFAQRLFFTPPRAPLREAERAVLESGQRFRVRLDDGWVAGWRWARNRAAAKVDGSEHEPERPIVLLIHGWGGHSGQMTELAAPLIAAGYEAVAIDLPGHGASSGERSSLVHFADAIRRAADYLGPIEALVAHSLGSAGATLALARGLRVRCAVYFAPVADFDDIWARFREGLGLSPTVWQEMVRRSEAWLGARFVDVVPVRLAPRLALPLLVLHDANDREVACAQGQALVRAWPGARLQTTAEQGHLRILKHPQSVRDTVAFIGGLPGTELKPCMQARSHARTA